MTTLRRDALDLVEKETAFAKLEALRKKAPYALDDDKELESYREEKYGSIAK